MNKSLHQDTCPDRVMVRVTSSFKVLQVVSCVRSMVPETSSCDPGEEVTTFK